MYYIFGGVFLCLSSHLSVVAGDVDFDPFSTAFRVNASLHACYRNHPLEYPDKQEEGMAICPYYFERDTTTNYWCRDKSCAISAAIEEKNGGGWGKTCSTPHDGYVAPDDSAFFLGENFITEDKEPAPIPCGLALTDQSDFPGSEGVACVQGEGWASTPLNRVSKNMWNVDFEAPSYQSNSCCSSVARFGFAGKHAGISNNAGPRNIHDPFGKDDYKGLRIACDVNRKSYYGNSCGKGRTWDDFYGTGVCGIDGLYDWNGNPIQSRMDQVTQWALENSVTIETHPTYCSDENQKSACDTWMASSGYNNQDFNQPCESPTFEMAAMSCPYFSGNDYQRFVRGPPLNKEEKGQCRACHSILKAFSAFPCSGSQHEFVDKTAKEFRVCSSACDVLFSTCGLPTQRGGMFVQTNFDFTTGTFPNDYSSAEGMCKALWDPHEESIWASEGFKIVVVDDSVEGHQGCVALERLIADFNYDTQNFIFDYEAIRGGEGYCSTEDPLYDKSAPCGDLEKEVEMEMRRRRLTGGSANNRAEGGKTMHTRGDIGRAEMIAAGWPWELTWKDIVMIAGIAVGVGIVIIVISAWLVRRRRRKKMGEKMQQGIAMT